MVFLFLFLLLLLLLLLIVQGGHLDRLLLANLLRLDVAELKVLRLLLNNRLFLANFLCLLLALNMSIMRAWLSGPPPPVVEAGELAHLDLLALSVLVPGHHLVRLRLRLAHPVGFQVANLLGLLNKGVLAGRPMVDMVAVESIGVSLGF